MNGRSADDRSSPPTTARDEGHAPISRRGYLLGGLGALAALGTAGVAASLHADVGPVVSHPAPSAALDLPVGDLAPAVRPAGWLNTRPLTSASLVGHVVLYYFWTFECINCQHVQPHVQAWHARYAGDGLTVLSIHAPEFSVEADPKNVARYVATNDIRYPVALDPASRVWRAFGNRYWPAFYLHDRQGRRRLTHFGEGSYGDTEDAIRELLGVRADSPPAVPG